MIHQSVRQLIADRYRAAHGAIPASDYPSYCIVGEQSRPLAALGYRRAGDGPLFLEAYLQAPVEQLIAARTGRAVPRSRLVEIGDHASRRPQATLLLWAWAAHHLAGEADFAVAVLTAPLRRMFARLGLPIVEIGPAAPERLGPSAGCWGRYYDRDPRVCAGEIDAARICFPRPAPAAEAAA
jgi:hypothetical protein